MTLVAEQPVVDPPVRQSAHGRNAAHRIWFAALLAATGLLYVFGLSASGWANSFYSAAVQAGSTSWTALLFGSSDAANSITVDKTPAALWVMDASVRLFGLSSWSVLAPQAVQGILAVAVLYVAVRRISGPSAALLAGAVLALTPVATLMFRFNNPDALLTLLLVSAAYCVVRACENHSSRWWLPLAGVAVGLAFLTKMLQAFLVVPGFVLAYLLCAHAPLPERVRRTLAATAAVLVSGGWYLALVALWPVRARPYIGGSQHNSIIELALGYNGFGRLTGNETGGLGNLNFDVGWGRLFGRDMGIDIAWLIPAAVICIAAGLWITRRARRTDSTRAALIIWGSWLLVTGVAFSYADGIIHPYYTVALAPAIAAGIGIGTPLLWRRRTDIRAATTLSGAVLISTVLACVLLARDHGWQPWLRPSIAVAGVGAAALLLVAGRLRPVAIGAIAVLAAAACLAGPAAYSVATALTPHEGAIPSPRPARQPGQGFGGFLGSPQPGAALSAALAADAASFTWTAATVGSNNAAGYQLASRTPVMAVGGFNGTDPSPTLDQFRQDVAEKKIHYFIGGTMMGPRGATPSSSDATDIAEWAGANYPAHTIDGVTFYDLTGEPGQSHS
jgi:4-amino-4-deoxy-L-arabinose transferase-like glycosyltransferase